MRQALQVAAARAHVRDTEERLAGACEQLLNLQSICNQFTINLQSVCNQSAIKLVEACERYDCNVIAI